jgi:leader peptidase (prepilin peptidase)/N-methyltransferase
MSHSQLTVLLVFSGILGLVIGSFLNVCIFRLPRNCMSIVKPRSRCPKCLTWIAWYDNLPVISWIALGGKCRQCRSPISIRYTLVELLTGALFLWVGWRAIYGSAQPGWPQAVRFALEAWFVSAMIVCTFIDLEFRILPDEITLSGVVIGLATAAAFPALFGSDLPVLVRSPQGIVSKLSYHLYPNYAIPWSLGNPHLAALLASAAGALAGGGAIWLVGVLGKWMFRKEAMGFGDVKFMAMVGAVLGWRGVMLTFLIACLWGSLFGIGRLITVRRMGYVPFGPFLAVGALTMLFVPGLVDRAIGAYMAFNQSLIERLLH